MNIILASDSFKESLTAVEAAEAIEEGFKKVFPNAVYHRVPMADGGEGTVHAFVHGVGGTIKKLTVTGPLGEPIEAFYGLTKDKQTAIIEVAASSGLDKVSMDKRNPLKTTTFGFGELIKDALDEGVDEVILGLGGSATNDGGVGMVMSLGGELLDQQGESISPTGEGLAELHTIHLENIHPRIKEVQFRVACDVNNPLTGENGAAYIYGPQKGASPEQVKLLDRNLLHLSNKIQEYLDKEIKEVPGAGAAGGLAGGLMAFLDASLENGGELMIEKTGLEVLMKEADLVITGEGSINHQTAFGKTPIAVSRTAKKYDVPTIALTGRLNEGYESIYDEGIEAAFSILPGLTSLDEALNNGYENLSATSFNIARLVLLSKSI